jgi:hypothetical protein
LFFGVTDDSEAVSFKALRCSQANLVAGEVP